MGPRDHDHDHATSMSTHSSAVSVHRSEHDHTSTPTTICSSCDDDRPNPRLSPRSTSDHHEDSCGRDGHGHHHSKGHGHHHFKDSEETTHGHHYTLAAEDAQRKDVQRRLKIASCLCLIFLVSEIVGGLVSGSLAVLSDAAHLFSDLMSFLFAVAAGHIASMPSTDTYTYGFRRAEVVAALFSMVSLAICTLLLTGEGLRRLFPYIVSWATGTGIENIEEVDGEVMSVVAFIGVVVNVALALVLGVENHVHMPGDDHGCTHSHGHCHGHEEHHGDHHCHEHEEHEENDNFGLEEVDIEVGVNKSKEKEGLVPSSREDAQRNKPKKPKENINLRSAYLHVLGDLAQSVAVFIAGIVIRWKPEWRAIDPILSLIFCPIIFYSTIGIIRTSMNILLEGVPNDIELNEVRSSILSVDGVSKVSHLHVWSITHGSIAMSVHAHAKDPQSALHKVRDVCMRRHGIDHCTIQLEQDTLDGGPSHLHGHGHGHGHDCGHSHSPKKSKGGESELVELCEKP